jgi:hypothetical protein
VGPARQLPRAEGRGSVVRGRDGGLGQALGRFTRGGKGGEEEKQLGSGCVGGGLVAH